MNARLVRFELGPGKHDAAQALADDLAPQIQAQPGCHGVTVFGDESSGSYGIFVLWESREHADEAAKVISPQLQQHLKGEASAPPETGLFDVLS